MSFYSPVTFNSTSPVFAKHLNSIVAQQRIESFDSVTKLNCANNDFEYSNFDMVDSNVQLGCWMRVAMHSLVPYTVAHFVRAVMLHNHTTSHSYRTNPDQLLYVS